MGEIVKSYFEKLFDTMGDLDLYRVLESIPERVTAESNQHLNRLFTVIEVHIALFKMHPHKAAEPDVMPPSFFENFWDIVQDDVVEFCLAFLNDGILPKELNKTTI